jgi:DNA-binding IclR family transcriptional regulator
MKAPAVVIQSLARGLGLLELVGARGGAGALTDLCRAANLNRSTAHHLLQTLAAHGFVVQDEATRAYRVGPKVYRLAAAAWSEAELARLALPFLRELVRATGETANLAVRRGREALLLETVDGEGTLRVVDRVGAARPIHACAVGKVLLAFAPEDERNPVVDALELEHLTPRTVTDRGRLRRELGRIRAAGYALDDEEMARGVRCIAAPVYALPGQAVAAVGIAGPAARLSRTALLGLQPPLASAVRRLSARLARAGG